MRYANFDLTVLTGRFHTERITHSWASVRVIKDQEGDTPPSYRLILEDKSPNLKGFPANTKQRRLIRRAWRKNGDEVVPYNTSI